MTQGLGDIVSTPCPWLQYADYEMDPIRRSQNGSITPVTDWILYADHGMDPIRRSVTVQRQPLWDRLDTVRITCHNFGFGVGDEMDDLLAEYGADD